MRQSNEDALIDLKNHVDYKVRQIVCSEVLGNTEGLFQTIDFAERVKLWTERELKEAEDWREECREKGLELNAFEAEGNMRAYQEMLGMIEHELQDLNKRREAIEQETQNEPDGQS